VSSAVRPGSPRSPSRTSTTISASTEAEIIEDVDVSPAETASVVDRYERNIEARRAPEARPIGLDDGGVELEVAWRSDLPGGWVASYSVATPTSMRKWRARRRPDREARARQRAAPRMALPARGRGKALADYTAARSDCRPR
jgi:hypothetical protein